MPTHAQESAVETRTSRLLLWYAFFGGPVAWLAHIGARYPLVPTACAHEFVLALHLVTMFTLAAILGAAASAVLILRRTRSAREQEHVPSIREGYMAYVGLAFSLLFAVVIIAELVPSLLQDPCVHVRL